MLAPRVCDASVDGDHNARRDLGQKFVVIVEKSETLSWERQCFGLGVGGCVGLKLAIFDGEMKPSVSELEGVKLKGSAPLHPTYESTYLVFRGHDVGYGA